MTREIDRHEYESPIKEKSESTKKNNRIFKGNPNYVNFLNREVKEFFHNKPISTYNEKPYFQDSRINSKGQVIYRKDEEFGNGCGTMWTNNEKEVFFNCLARYSIHQIETICDNLPTKSAFEIMNYYESLSKELKKLKNQIVKRRKYYKVKIIKDKQEIEYRYKSLPNRQNLIKYESIPTAYEMSEKFIKMEEIQAEMIAQRERSKTNDENQRFKRQFSDYTLSKRQKLDINVDRENLEPLYQNSRNEEYDKGQADLINYDTACELSRSLYLNNNITLLHNNKLVPKLHYKSLVLFDQIARLTTEKIILKIIELKIVLIWLNQRQIPFEESMIPLIITHGDIYRAINNLKLFETPTGGYQSLEQAGVSSMRINNYFSQLPERLNVEIEKDIEAKDHESFSIASYKKLMLNDADKKYGERFRPEFLDNEFTSARDQSQNKARIIEKEGNSIPHISSLPNNNPTIMNETRLASHKSTKEFEELIDLELVRLELESLDEKDMNKSTMHEHSLLTYLTQYNKDTENVRESMYTNDEAEFILGEQGDSDNDLNELGDEVANKEIDEFDIAEDSSSQEDNNEEDKLNVMITKSLLNNFNYMFANYSNELD